VLSQFLVVKLNKIELPSILSGSSTNMNDTDLKVSKSKDIQMDSMEASTKPVIFAGSSTGLILFKFVLFNQSR
jgi:hypothetical protein